MLIIICLLFGSEYENGEIPVNEYSRELLCLGNTSKHNIKVQLKMIEGNDVYEIKSDPLFVTIKPYHACEFEKSLKPNYTSKIKDKIACATLNINK
ncbi:protein kinase domain containing protein, partial [Entamoeba invadens IP1]